MRVVPLPGLENLVIRIESGLIDALREREQLGLSVPQRPKINVMFYQGRNRLAFANDQGGERTMGVNTAVLWQPLLSERERSDLESVMRYFDVARELIREPSEETILLLMNDPESILGSMESSMSVGALDRRKNYLSMRGTTYEQYREILVRDAHQVRDTLAHLLPRFEQLAPDVNLSFIRHELDHIDFYSAPFSIHHNSRYERAVKAGVVFRERGDDASRHEYARARMEFLGSKALSRPLLEARAMFFDLIKPGMWDRVDYDVVGSNVLWRFLKNYVEDSLVEDLVDTLTLCALNRGRMSAQTAQYVQQTTSYQRLDEGAVNRYNIWPPEVDFSEANRILYCEIPYWKAKMADMAGEATEVFAAAYRDDPSRLKRAMVARTPEEYIALCDHPRSEAI